MQKAAQVLPPLWICPDLYLQPRGEFLRSLCSLSISGCSQKPSGHGFIKSLHRSLLRGWGDLCRLCAPGSVQKPHSLQLLARVCVHFPPWLGEADGLLSFLKWLYLYASKISSVKKTPTMVSFPPAAFCLPLSSNSFFSVLAEFEAA